MRKTIETYGANYNYILNFPILSILLLFFLRWHYCSLLMTQRALWDGFVCV